ncbi:MAG: RagB/SusD family nutrient uptake outer membrane protein [Bacteroidales bacterium]
MNRKIFYAFAAVSLLIGASSCSDMLDTRSESQVESDKVFDNVENAQKAITGIYNSMMEERAYRNTLVGVMMSNTDAELNSGTKQNSSDGGMLDVAMYRFSAAMSNNGFNQSNASDPWSRLYKSIELCNQAIKGIRTYGDLKNPEMNYLLGEALTLRAFFYQDLIKIWGDVPARFEPVTNQTIYLGVSSRAEIYDRILADLETAATLVPWSGTESTKTVQRVSKGFVKGLRARIALHAAGKALLPKSTYGEIGYIFEEEAKRLELYRIAADETEEVINSGTYKLADAYEHIFMDQCQDVISIGRESVFEIPAANGTRGEFMSYVAQRRKIDQYTAIDLAGRIQMVPSFFYDYEMKDLRRDISAKPYYFEGGVAKMATDASSFYLSKWRPEWMNRKINSKDDGVNFMVMRLADIYLMNAEANNVLGNLQIAKQRILDVRKRAFIQEQEASAPVFALSSQEEILVFIQKERAKEFIGEGMRRWDLMRWGILKETLDQTNQDLEALRHQSGRYAQVRDVIYYKENAQKNGFEIYGFGPDEDGQPIEPGYKEKTKWIKLATKPSESSCFDNYIGKVTDPVPGSVYFPEPEVSTHIRQVMPIMNIILTTSQNKLTNSYGF